MSELNSSQTEYFSRIQNVISYISLNITENLELNALAKVACFSPFHFHRIFSSILGETPQEFVKRIRLEKSANMLLNNRNSSITIIALECGFSSSAVFSRAFKNHFNISASEWKSKNKIKNSNNSKTISNESKELTPLENYFVNLNKSLQNNRRNSKMDVEVKSLPSVIVAYVANTEGYFPEKIDAAWKKLGNWAGPRGLINKSSKFIGISFDNPEITPVNKCRYYACITISDEIETSNGVGKMVLNGGKHGITKFNGPITEISNVYKEFFGSWLPQSGYQPTDSPCFDIYHKSPDVEPIGIVDMEICVPLKAL